MSDGTNRTAQVTWSGTGGTITTGGLYTAGATAGSYRVIGVLQGGTLADTSSITITAAPPVTGVADPTLLPVASGQVPPTGSYGRTLTSGQRYTDPVTGVPVLKVTDASTPTSNARAHHDYSEGGPYISQPWQAGGVTYYTLMVAADGRRYLVDLRYDALTLSNWRSIDIAGDLAFSFSLNPATPRIAFTELNSAVGAVQRYNTATNQTENTGNWPWRPNVGGLSWLQNQLNDRWFVAMGSATVVGFRASDGLQRSWSGISGLDEPHIDREQAYVYVAAGGVHLLGNLENGGALTRPAGDPSWTNTPSALATAAHTSPLRGHIVGAARWDNDGYWRHNVLTGQTVTFARANAVVGFPGEYHQAGQWVFNNGDGGAAQWFVIDPSGSDWAAAAIRSGMIGIVKTDGSPARLVAVHNSTGGQGDYQSQPHTTIAPDGKLVMWTSDSRATGQRKDLYLARLPVR
jgi:hypothetical protein